MPHVLCSVLHRKLFYSTPDRCRLPLQSTRAASAIAARRCGPTACRSWCTSKGRLGSPRPPCPSPSTTWTRPTALWAMSSMTGWSSHGRSACSLTRQWFSPDAACTEVQASQGVPVSLHSLRQVSPNAAEDAQQLPTAVRALQRLKQDSKPLSRGLPLCFG